jgi:hypothetical protein
VSSEPRREFRTGSRRALSAGSSSHERFIIIVGIALLAVALLIAITRREPTPAVVPPAAPQEARVVTVPVPMPVESPAPPPRPPAPIKPPVPVHRAPAPVTLAAPAAPPPEPHGPPSASELVALYRSVGQTLDRVRDDALWQRYRWIRLADYLVTPEKRAEAARMLDAIASDARGK